ncbi:fibronectin type III domain-containing protein [Desertimonas flava]|uniref:fibronectin type III domain-containing protein n=1 Tax=Desertimonas flava TaxID=2064846 RepID=UPI001D0CCB90|nr:fibronectin type III domain-containing protein [Desertimonas flava]
MVAALTPSSAPLGLVASSGDRSVRLWWSLPASTGGTPITDYAIQRSPNGTTGWVTINDGVSTARSYTVTGLTNGTRYWFRVFARNGVGTGPASNVVHQVARTTPTAPRSLVAAPTNRSGEVRLTWSPHASNGGSAVTDYVIQRSPNGTSGWTTINDGVSVANAYTVTGLANGTRYWFRVISTNAVGPGPASNVAAGAARTITTAPTALSAVPTYVSGQIRLSWTAPSSNGGSPISDYVIQRSPNGTSGWVTISDGASTGRSFTVTGLTNGTRYWFRVYARNAVGTGPGSNIAHSAPFTPRVPSAPRGFDIDASYEGLNLTWSAPEFLGGYPTYDYVVQVYDSTDGWWTYPDGVSTSTSLWIGVPGYGCVDMRVAAVNAVGRGQFSTIYDSCYFETPSVPRNTWGNGYYGSGNIFNFIIAWNEPWEDGGLDILGYTVEYWDGSSWVIAELTDARATQSKIIPSPEQCLRMRVAAVNYLGPGAYATIRHCR